MPSADDDEGCAYLFGRARVRRCGARRRPGSAYCLRHHALCHLRPGSAAETRRLIELQRLAEKAGGRLSARSGGPSRRFLERLEGAARSFSTSAEFLFDHDEEAL